MQYTENYQFRKPVIGVDDADVKDINFNSDRADTLIHNTQISLAPAYDLNETYDTGDVVMYETLMYKCKADNTTGAWDPSKWERTTAGEEGAGGGGGSSVVPNPSGTPTDTLETIEIEGTVYAIAGSGGGGSGYLSRKIWDYIEDNNNVIPYGTYTVSLNDDINNYDVLVIENVSSSTDLTDPNWAATNLWYVDVNALNNNWNNNYVTYTSWDNRATKFHIANTTFEALNNNGMNTNGLVRVYGIKCGGGVGSEIIPITAGNDTTSRTFTFDKTPKFIKFYWGDPVITGGWALDGEIVWGQSYMNFRAKQMGASVGNVDGGIDSITYGADGKSVTITAGNAFGALNTSNSSGYMYVDYGGGSGGSAVKDILYSDANGAPHQTDVALAHNIFDYDEVYFKVSNPTDIAAFNAYTQQVFMPMMYNVGERWGIQALYDQRVVEITFPSDGLSFRIVRTAGDYSNNTVYEVIGIKH